MLNCVHQLDANFFLSAVFNCNLSSVKLFRGDENGGSEPVNAVWSGPSAIKIHERHSSQLLLEMVAY